MSDLRSLDYVGRANNPSAGNNVLNLEASIYEFYFISGEVDATDPNNITGDGSGDLLLEADPLDPGAIDGDTKIVIDGVAYDFIYEATGTLPVSNGVPDQFEGTQVIKIEVVGLLDAQGKNIKIVFAPDRSITAEDWAVPQNQGGFTNGNITLNSIDTDPEFVCYQRGTLISTPDGSRSVEALRAGDEVLVLGGAVAQIAWISSQPIELIDLIAIPNSRPVCVAAGSLGNGTPTTDLWTSPQHRLLVQGHLTETLFGASEVLVAAKHLDFGDLAKGKKRPAEIEYFHILLDKHDVLIANGAPAESLFLGDQAQTMLSDESLAEIEARFPREQHPEMWTGEVAAPTLTAAEAAVLSQALRANLQNAKNQAAAA